MAFPLIFFTFSRKEIAFFTSLYTKRQTTSRTFSTITNSSNDSLQILFQNVHVCPTIVCVCVCLCGDRKRLISKFRSIQSFPCKKIEKLRKWKRSDSSSRLLKCPSFTHKHTHTHESELIKVQNEAIYTN